MPGFVPRFAILFLALSVLPARAAGDDEDWALLGGALTILQQIVHVAATSKDPEAARKRVDAVLAGKSPEANRVAARMMDDMLEDMPPEQRATVSAIAQDLLTIARREQAQPPSAQAGAPRRAPSLEIAE